MTFTESDRQEQRRREQQERNRLYARLRATPMTDPAKVADYHQRSAEAYERLCETVANPHRTRVTVRAADLRIVLTELAHRK